MMETIRRVTLGRLGQNKNVEADFKAGDTVDVFVKVKEGEKERVQLFSGTVLRVSGSGMSRSFTVRKVSDGVGVERTFPFASPGIDRIKLVARGAVRRSRLYYLRGLRGKAARIEFELAGTDGVAGAAAKAKPAVDKEPAKPQA